VSSARDVLLAQEEVRVGVIVRAPGQAQERDLSWMDFSALRSFSKDGRKILFDESGEGGGDEGTIFLRDTDGSPPMRIGPGFGMGLSPDGRFVVGSTPVEPKTARILPVGAGEPRRLAELSFPLTWADWMPDGKAILLSGGESGRGARLWLLGLSGGPPRPVSSEGVQLIAYTNLISPDGKLVPATGPDRKVSLFPLDGGSPRPIPGLAAGEQPCGWDEAGRTLLIYRPGEMPARISRLDLQTGTRQPWIELMPRDPTGVNFIRPPHFSGDAGAYAYSYSRWLSELYLVKGLK